MLTTNNIPYLWLAGKVEVHVIFEKPIPYTTEQRRSAASSPCLFLGVARIQGLRVYARLISQFRDSILYRAWCWSLWSVRLLGNRGAGASLMLGYCGEQQRRGQKAYNIVADYLLIELLVKYHMVREFWWGLYNLACRTNKNLNYTLDDNNIK